MIKIDNPGWRTYFCPECRTSAEDLAKQLADSRTALRETVDHYAKQLNDMSGELVALRRRVTELESR